MIEQHRAERLTPYDTGERLKPEPWPCEAQGFPHYGKVDFDDDEGTTVATAWISHEGGVYTLHVDTTCTLVVDARHGGLDVRANGGLTEVRVLP